MAGPLALETPPLPVNGLDTTSSPGSMASGYAPVHQNLLVHRAGLLPFRGPITDPDSIDLTAAKILAGVWTSGDHALVSFADQDATRDAEPWTRALRPVAADTTLALPEADMLQIDFSDGSSSTLAGDVAFHDQISGRGAAIKEFVFGYAYAAALSGEDDLERNYWGRKVVRWDVIGGTVTDLDNAPKNGLDVIAHLSRVFVLGGIDIPGGVSTIDDMEWNSLYYSDLFGPTADTTDEWKDNDSGLVNKIVVGEDAGDFGVGLAHIGPDLMIFKRRAVYVLYGYSPDTFNVKPLAQEIGCLDQRSICESGGTVYWLSAQGLQSWDGENLLNLSRPVEATLNRALAISVGDQGIDGGYACVSKLANDYLLVSVGRQNFNTAALRSGTKFCAMVHAPTGRWTTFASDATVTSQPTYSFSTLTNQVICDTENLIKVNNITDPELADEEDRGLDSIGAVTPARTNLVLNPDMQGAVAPNTPPNYTFTTVPPYAVPSAQTSLDHGEFDTADTGESDPLLPPFVSVDRVAFVIGEYDPDHDTWGDIIVEQEIAVTSGTEYTFSAYVSHWETLGDPNSRAQLEVANDADVVKATSSTSAVSTAWTRKSVTFTADSSTTWKFRIIFTPGGGSYISAVMQAFTAVMLEASGDLNDFIVGTDPGGDDVLSRIPIELDYPLTLSSTPDLMSQAHRILTDYTFQVVGEDDDAMDAFLVTVQNGDGSTVQSQYALPSQGEDGDYLFRRRHVKDCFNEIGDAQVRFRYDDDVDADIPYPSLAKAEIYNVHVEFQSTRQKRST